MITTLPALVGANIKWKRLELGLSQIVLAAQIQGVSAGDLSKIETGKVNMTLKTMEKIAVALDCNPREFFEEVNDANT